MRNYTNKKSIFLAFVVAYVFFPLTSSAVTTTVNGTLGDLDGDGDGGAAEALVLQTAVQCWDARVTTVRNLTLNLTTQALANARGTGSVQAITGGIPTGGRFTIEDGTNINWFVDPTPLTALEFTPDNTAQWRFINGAGGAANADLLRAVAHEIGHASGWICGNTSCGWTPDNFNYDALMVPAPANFVLNTNVTLQSGGFNLTLRGDGLGSSGAVLNELSHVGPPGAFNATPDMMFGRTGNGVRETHSIADVSMFANVYGDIVNLPLTVNAGANQVAECNAIGGANVTLDASGSTDPEGDVMSFVWTCPVGVPLTTPNNVSTSAFVSINTPISCRVDATDQAVCPSDADQVTVQVVDTTPPQLTAPADVTEECAAPGGTAVDIGTPVTGDICDASPTVSNDSPALFPLGDTDVTWTAMDNKGNQANNAIQKVTVADTTPPEVMCNAPATILPPDATISFTATAQDQCSASITPVVTGYDCFTYTKKGKRIDKTGSCVVEMNGDTISVTDSGGVANQISWTVEATDGNGNATSQSCGVTVVNPRKET
jgi:hypothetical protein